ncbi:MAG: DUF1330 domain-containing protein [Cupriavidus sp.]|uniref:DUF1330 domain-containing protein n=1 Tax=Cupriavidus pauculus TaxID=82633 RepID=UPI000782991D|nr:DUF1330 domain-containing protein [Cupriavidus pauculus]MBU67751.1 DUF1330 domain-containing protein [Cupriavidus sp.]KAB0602154.1 DUF1330 domain-containing protein [Cupriavidus pauculus]MBY4732940.1 DUF1330 domain-containing protein [Cupriavidus pauculus]MCM3605469.1 DUF1330 domain-containing protein [Cupriavidus pauculus]UAL02531.1 DUF1330 domain-containing protein [Cupriavidus pauculus]
MKKGYWVASVDVANAAGYQGYITANKAVFDKYGARFLVRNGEKTVVEGTPRSRIVVIEFESYARALECYRSPEYQALVALRAPHAQADIVVIEGYEDV